MARDFFINQATPQGIGYTAQFIGLVAHSADCGWQDGKMLVTVYLIEP